LEKLLTAKDAKNGRKGREENPSDEYRSFEYRETRRIHRTAQRGSGLYRVLEKLLTAKDAKNGRKGREEIRMASNEVSSGEFGRSGFEVSELGIKR